MTEQTRAAEAEADQWVAERKGLWERLWHGGDCDDGNNRRWADAYDLP